MKSADRFMIIIAAVIVFLLASTGITAVYWVVGGRFSWGIPLTIYLIVELYFAVLVVRVARKRPEQLAKELNRD
jgi:hypothetical protein